MIPKITRWWIGEVVIMMKMLWGKTHRFITVAVLELLWLGYASAQLSTASLNGTIQDQSGGVVPNATVVLTRTGTGVSLNTVTDSAGRYSFPILQPGVYTLTAEAQGFKKVTQENIDLQVGQVGEVNLTLAVGNVNQTVEVNAASPQLETESSSLGSVVDTKLVQELPLNGRNFV